MQIIFENKNLVVLAKPFGRSTQSDVAGQSLLDDLQSYISKRDNKNQFLGLVHRLDRDVGGLIVFAKDSKTASRLSEQIRTGEFKKFYIVEVYGCPDDLYGEFEDYLLHNEEKHRADLVSPDLVSAKLAKLSYTVLYKGEKSSIVLVQLHTGRYHQIRIQFASRSLPLVGDLIYGRKGANLSPKYKQVSNFPNIQSADHTFSLLKLPLPHSLGTFWDLFDIELKQLRRPIHLVSSIICFDNIRVQDGSK